MFLYQPPQSEGITSPEQLDPKDLLAQYIQTFVEPLRPRIKTYGEFFESLIRPMTGDLDYHVTVEHPDNNTVVVESSGDQRRLYLEKQDSSGASTLDIFVQDYRLKGPHKVR